LLLNSGLRLPAFQVVRSNLRARNRVSSRSEVVSLGQRQILGKEDRAMRHTQALQSKAEELASPTRRTANPLKSWATSPAVRRVMQGYKSRDTKPEIAVRCAVHAMGMRYRVAARPLVGVRRTANPVFRGARVAVFVDGCFWHGCPSHHAPPKTNASYWAQKIEGNKIRDQHTTALLRATGWTVLRFWSIDPDKWRPLVMSFAQFYGLGDRVQPSKLAEIPEEAYRPFESMSR
jgi:DNA mismatch endonuclease (patch repair protein)